MHPSSQFMQTAIDAAIEARKSGDYAVGAVVAKDDKIISSAGNRIKLDNDPTHHAEIVAIRGASKILGARFLHDCVLYTTHEPCPMCASAAIWARMKGIVFGAMLGDMIDYREKNGSSEWTWRTIDIPAAGVIEKGDPELFLIEGFMRDECKRLFHS